MFRLAGAFAALTLLVACDTSTVEPTPQLEWHGTLVAEAGWDHLTGQAAMAWIEGSTSFLAGAEIMGDEANARRPWHVHHNTCAEGGGIVGSDAHYPRLMVNVDGHAVAVTEVAATINPEADYHVNIHLSEPEMDVIIACADLELVS
jgi:hypothetical protein